MSKQVAGIDLPEVDALYETDEDLLKKIDIRTVEGSNFQEKVVKILEKIVEYNKNIMQTKDKAYRFFYYIRLGEGSILSPYYEELTEDKSCILVGLVGEALKKDDLFELIGVETIVGIGSNHFKPDNAVDSKRVAQYTQLKKEAAEIIKEMQLKWANCTKDTIGVSIEKFAKDLSEINKINHMNHHAFFKAKRAYLRQFLMFLQIKINNNTLSDPNMTPEEIKEVFEFYKNQFTDYQDTIHV